MPFILIKGTYHVNGYQPDGDSIRFQPDDLAQLQRLDGRPAEVNARNHVQLRIEAIDTLETHYKGFHQPAKFALAATKFLLKELGIKKVKFNPTGTTVLSSQDGTRGYIISRKVEQNGRPVSFVFTGDPVEADGQEILLDAGRLVQSLNLKSVQAGLAYPTYYEGLFPDLRQKFTEATMSARKARLRLWARDRTNAGTIVASLAAVTTHHVILPKLFRRIVSYMGNGGSIIGFKQYLAANPDPVFELTNGHSTHLDTFVELIGNKVRLTVEPEHLVFKE